MCNFNCAKRRCPETMKDVVIVKHEKCVPEQKFNELCFSCPCHRMYSPMVSVLSSNSHEYAIVESVEVMGELTTINVCSIAPRKVVLN